MSRTAEGLVDRRKVAAINDAFRKNSSNRVLGRFVMSASVAALPMEMLACVLAAMMSFDEFTADNDPYGEHDYGSFDVSVEGEKTRFCWKIDYYDLSMHLASSDPSNPAVTTRVLTLMKPEGY